MSMFSICFCVLSFFRCVFNQSGRNSCEFFISKSINCEKSFFYYKLDLYSKFVLLICFLMISICISVFGFVQLAVTAKLVPLQPYDRKYFSMKTANTWVFSTANRQHKFLSAVSRTPKFGPSCKRKTLCMTPISMISYFSKKFIFSLETFLSNKNGFRKSFISCNIF